MYDNCIGEIYFHMKACNSCKKGERGCNTPISKMTHKGNFMLCPDFISLSPDEIIDGLFNKKKCDLPGCIPNPMDCENLGCTKCPSGSPKCHGQIKNDLETLDESGMDRIFKEV